MGDQTEKDYFVEITSAVDVVCKYEKEWQKLDLESKIHLLEECIQSLTVNSTTYHDLMLSRRYQEDTLPQEKKKALEIEKTLTPLQTDVQLLIWMQTIKFAYKKAIKTKKFPQMLSSKLSPDKKKVFVEIPLATRIQRYITGVSMHLVIDNLPDKEDYQHNPAVFFEKNHGVGVIFGAGNYDSPIDILTAMFVHNLVAVYKIYPTTISMSKVFQHIFRPLIDRKFLVMCAGNLSESKTLLYDSRVTHWFMTGGTRTAYNVLYNQPTSPFQNITREISKEEIASKLVFKEHKEIYLELGNVCPYIICPEDWTPYDLITHAKHLAFALVYNGGHICVHPQVIITCKQWKQREEFFQELHKEIEKVELLPEFYPEAARRFQSFYNKCTEENILTEKSKWKNGDILMIRDCPINSCLLKEETFCRISAEVSIDTEAALDKFLPAATKLCNDSIYGSLGVTIISKSDCESSIPLQQCFAELNYGSISLNLWVVTAAIFPQLCWGGYPNSGNLANLVSGIGWFGNCYFFKNVLKSILVAPFHNNMHKFESTFQIFEIQNYKKIITRVTTALTRPEESILSNLFDGVKIISALLWGL